MKEQRFYGFAVDPRPVYIVQQPKQDDPPSPPAEPIAAIETKDLAPIAKPVEPPHRKRPKPETPAVSVPPSIERHSRKCQICDHPDRAMIEEDFILWSSPRAISVTHRIPEITLYRHAHALGLFNVRRESMRLSLDRVLERGPEAPVTGDTIIRAVKAQACLTDNNHWVEPAKHVIFSPNPPRERFSGGRSFSSDITERGEAANLPAAAGRCADSPAASIPIFDGGQSDSAPAQGAN